MNLLMGVKVLQQAIIDLLLDIMVECCQSSEGSSNDDYDVNSKNAPDGNNESAKHPVNDRLDAAVAERTDTSTVQSSDMSGFVMPVKTVAGLATSPPETSATGSLENTSFLSKTKWPEQSEEFLSLIVNSLKALMERLEKPDVWERILFQSFGLLADSNDEPLTATEDFIFKAALQSHHLLEAVRSVCDRLKDIGDEVSPCILDYLGRMVSSCGDIAEAILRDIDFDNDSGERPTSRGLFVFGENSTSSENRCFSDIYVLIEMLSIPCLATEASQTFERSVARRALTAQSVAMVLERQLTQYIADCLHSDVVIDGETIEQLRVERDDFSSMLVLAETLSLSRDTSVREFVKTLYTILFKWYANESYLLRMVKKLVDHAVSTTGNCRENDLDLEILVLLIREGEIVRPVLSMMREVAELANVERAALWHQLCANEDEIVRIREERKVENSDMAKEKAVENKEAGGYCNLGIILER